MEIIVALMLFVAIGLLVSRAGPARPRELAHDVASPQLAALAARLGLDHSDLAAREWTSACEVAGRGARVSVVVEPSLEAVEFWSVQRVEVIVDVTLPGQLTLGTRMKSRQDDEPNALVSRALDRAYWVDGSRAEVLASLDPELTGALLAADRAAPRWTRIAIGESAVFERLPQGEYRLSDVESDLPALLASASACVSRVPRSETLPPLLRRRVVSEDEPLPMRLRCAHALLTEFGGSRAARQLIESLDDLPDALYAPCAFWDPERVGDGADHEGGLVVLLTRRLEPDDAADIHAALTGAGWSPSPGALLTLEAHGLDVTAALDAVRALGVGQITLSHEDPTAGGLSPAEGVRGALTDTFGEG